MNRRMSLARLRQRKGSAPCASRSPRSEIAASIGSGTSARSSSRRPRRHCYRRPASCSIPVPSLPSSWNSARCRGGYKTAPDPENRSSGLRRHDPDQRRRSTAEETGAWQDGFPSSKWPRLRLSFSAWLYSPSSGFPFGQNHEGRGAPRLAPLLLALPAHRLARPVLRLVPRRRRPAAIGRIRPLRHLPSSPMRQTCSNTVGPSPVSSRALTEGPLSNE